MKNLILACAVSLALSAVLFFPIISHPTTAITDDSDGLLGAWTIAKVQNNLLAGKPIFAGDTFYPHSNTIIFSDIFVTSAIGSLPLKLLTDEPLKAYSFSNFIA